MGGRLLVLALLVLAGVATAHPPPGACVEVGCARFVDDDHDHQPDGVVVGSATGWTATNAEARQGGVQTYGEVLAGLDHDEGILTVWEAEANATNATALVTVGTLEHHAYEGDLAWVWTEYHDHDGDGAPDEAHVEAGAALNAAVLP